MIILSRLLEESTTDSILEHQSLSISPMKEIVA